jgi:hypothetical protein
MVEKMQFTAAHPEPAPEAKDLLGNLLRRNLLWVTLIKDKYDARVRMFDSADT